MYFNILITFLFALFSFDDPSSEFKANFNQWPNVLEAKGESFESKAWKNESILIPIEIFGSSGQEIHVEFENQLEGFDFELFQLHQVEADSAAGFCGENKRTGDFAVGLIPDRAELLANKRITITDDRTLGLIKLKVNEGAPEGLNKLNLNLSSGTFQSILSLDVLVKNAVLEDIDQLDFTFDFWHLPLMTADHYKVEPWSENHFDYLRKDFKQLSAINQKVVTVPIFWDLFNTKIRDLDEMVIQITKKANGEYAYDFSNFDKLVSTAFESGIDEYIGVHNIFSWNNYFFYFDESAGKVVSGRELPGREVYTSFWEPFLKAFSKHTTSKGWRDKIIFVIDERNHNLSIETSKMVHRIEPKFKMGYAGRYSRELSKMVYDYSIPVNVVLEPDQIQERIDLGYKTTHYTTCFNKQPNMLMSSNLDDIYFMVTLAEARHYNGMLRWAFNMWKTDIAQSAIYSDLPSGDGHIVYPDDQPSLRYLVLMDALEEIGKLRAKQELTSSKELLTSHTRYYLLNSEEARMQMVSAMKKHLNE